MIIYKCRFTNDEMMSDAFKPEPVLDEAGEEIPGIFAVSSCKVSKESGANVDIGCGGEFGGSGGEEQVDDTVELVNNVIDETFGFGYNEIPGMTKKDIKEYLQGFCKEVRGKLKDDDDIPGPRVKAFTQSAPKFCKYLLGKHDEMQFYCGMSMDPDGCMAFAYYEGVDPKFIFIREGFKEEKV